MSLTAIELPDKDIEPKDFKGGIGKENLDEGHQKSYSDTKGPIESHSGPEKFISDKAYEEKKFSNVEASHTELLKVEGEQVTHEKNSLLEEKNASDSEKNPSVDTDKPLDSGIKKEIQFSITYNTQFGERIFVVGSSPDLGDWDISKGLELHWTENNVWTGTANLSDSPIEYKYVCISEYCNKWEGGVNRVLSSESLESSDVWQEDNQ
jgi:Starch binding domain